MLPIDEVVQLNRYAQGLRSMAEASSWFVALDGAHKQDVLRELAALLQQAHPRATEVAEAIRKAGLRPTYTPSVLMSSGPFSMQAAKVIALPESEREKAFRLFIALLGIADERRRLTECVDGCGHWWHQDLSDELKVQKLVGGG